MMTSGALTLAGLSEYNSKMGLGFLVYCVSMCLIPPVAHMIQVKLGYGKSHWDYQDDEHKQNVLLPAD